MTKSQNTKNEQLTEQWKKGKLPEGWYYVKDEDGQIIIAEYSAYCIDKETNETECDWSCSSEPKQALDKVPSYEEWQASEKYNKHLEDVIELKDKQATETSIAYNKLAEENEELKEILERHKKATAKSQIRSCDLEIINAQLKELLKKVKDYLPEFETPMDILAKIDEVLK